MLRLGRYSKHNPVPTTKHERHEGKCCAYQGAEETAQWSCKASGQQKLGFWSGVKLANIKTMNAENTKNTHVSIEAKIKEMAVHRVKLQETIRAKNAINALKHLDEEISSTLSTNVENGSFSRTVKVDAF
jgi:hypothetical protein